jgi:hypothetical protein
MGIVHGFQSCLWSKQRVRARLFFPGDLQSDARAKSLAKSLKHFSIFFENSPENPPPITCCRLINSPNFCLSPTLCEPQLYAITINAEGKRSDRYHHDIIAVECAKAITS